MLEATKAKFRAALPEETFVEQMDNMQMQTITLTDRQWYALVHMCSQAVDREQERAIENMPETVRGIAAMLNLPLATLANSPGLEEAINIHNNLVMALQTSASPPLIAAAPMTDEPVEATASFSVFMGAACVILTVRALLFEARDVEDIDSLPSQDVENLLMSLWRDYKRQIAAVVPGFGDGLE